MAPGTAEAPAVEVVTPAAPMGAPAAPKALHMRAANETAQAARVAREQQTGMVLEKHSNHPAHTASHSTTAAAVALELPAEAEVDIVLRFPQYSL